MDETRKNCVAGKMVNESQETKYSYRKLLFKKKNTNPMWIALGMNKEICGVKLTGN
jgi:hypothetical protein